MATSSLASLVVSLEANVAKFSTDMKSASDVTTATMKQIQTAASVATSALAGLGAAFTLGAAVQWAKDVIASASALDDLADSTGSSVENLSKLKNQAEISGQSFEELSGLVLKLSAGMAGASDESTKVGRALAALGVQSRDPAQAVQEVAVALSKYADGVGKAALARDLFGKGGPAFLAQLKDIANLQGVSATRTAEQAAQAEKLEQSLRRLSVESNLFKDALLSNVVPALNNVIERFKLAREAGEGFFAALIRASTNTSTITEQIKAAGDELVRLKAKAEATDFLGINVRKLLPDALLITDEDVRKQEAKVKALKAIYAQAMPDYSVFDKDKKPILDYTPTVKGAKEAKSSIIDFATEVLKLESALARVGGGDGGMKHTADAMETVKKAFIEGKTVTDEWVDRLLDAADALDQAELRFKASAFEANSLAAGLQKASEQEKAFEDAVNKTNDAILDQNEALKVEVATLGMTNDERDIYITMARRQKEVDEGNTEGVRRLNEQLNLLQQRSDKGAFLKSIEDGRRVLEDVSKSLAGFFTDLFEHGSSAFKNLWDNFKHWALQAFAEIAAKQVIVSLVGSLGLGGAGGAQAAGGGGLGNLGSILGIGKDVASIFGGGSASLASIGTSIGASLGLDIGVAAAGLEAGAGAAAGFGSAVAGAGGAAAAFGATLATAVPVVGAIIAGGLLLKSYLDSKKGGPMTREFGTSGAGIETFGDLSGIHKLDTGASTASALETYAATTKGTYDGIVKALGGSGSGAFAIYTSQDPRGKAPNQLDVRSTVGGAAAYTANIENQLGRDPAVLQARLELEASRAVLGALQLSSFPKYLADLFNSIDASTATAEQISNIIAVAGAIKQAVDLIPQLETLDPATIQGIIDAVGGVQAFAQSVGFLAQNFSTATDKLDEAQTSLTEGFAELHLAVPQTHADFLALLDSFDLTTDSGRALYAAVLKLSGAFVEVKGTAEQAAEALKTSINALHEAQTSYTGIRQAPDNQAELTALLTTFIADKPWAQGLSTDALLSGIAQIHDDDFARYSPENQSLIVQIINVAAAIKNSTTTIANAIDDGTAASVAAYNAAEQRANTEATVAARLTASGGALAQQRIDLFGTLAGQGGGDFGQRLALQIAYITTEISKLESKKTNIYIAAEIKALQAGGAALAQTLALYSTLSATYGGDVAEQLVAITATYKQQSKELQGNAGALALLNASFETQWNAIINGTAAGVGGVQDELKRLQQSILDYVDSLRISTESPLTPTEKLAEARRQYETTLASAQGGDKKALGDITGSADAYIKLARDYYASSSAYTDIFNSITGQLTDLGTADLSAVSVPMNAADEALLNALPVGSKIMSAADMQAIIGWFGGAQTGAAESLTGISGDTTKRTGTWEDSWFVRPRVTAPSTDEGITAGTDTVATAVMETAIITASAGTRDADRIIAAVDASGNKIIEALTVAKK